MKAHIYAYQTLENRPCPVCGFEPIDPEEPLIEIVEVGHIAVGGF
jgi:hypothetical protein